MSFQDCPVCLLDDVVYEGGHTVTYSCRRCGTYSLTSTAEAVLANKGLDSQTRANASAWIREHEGVTLNSDDLETLFRLRAPSVAERAMKLLQALERKFPTIGMKFSFPGGESIAPWLAATWSRSGEEVAYLAVDYLFRKLQALEGMPDPDLYELPTLVGAQITPRGYELLEEMRQENPESSIGFCAMWFGDDLKPLWTKAIEPAIRLAGYEPKRMDEHEHVNRIDDEIVAMIRRSRFVVADFTGHRGGVYFEAGYALGLGLRVIWLCREDHSKEVHFDTRQYNFLVWKAGEYSDLAKRLQNRIEATLGRGPIRS